MAGELPVGIGKEAADEIANAMRNDATIVPPEMPVLGLDELAVKIVAGGIWSYVRAHGLRGAAEHVPVVLEETRVGVAVTASHFEGNGVGDGAV